MSQQKSRFMQWMDHLHDLLTQGKEIPPVPPQVIQPLPRSDTQIVYPTIDTDGAYVPRETLGTPVAQYRWLGQDMLSWPGVTLSAQAQNNINTSNTQNIQETATLGADQNRFDPGFFSEAVNTGLPKVNGNYPRLENCLVYRGNNRPEFPPFTLADWPAAVAYWNETKVWPVIDHPVGSVAG